MKQKKLNMCVGNSSITRYYDDDFLFRTGYFKGYKFKKFRHPTFCESC